MTTGQAIAYGGDGLITVRGGDMVMWSAFDTTAATATAEQYFG